MNGNECRLGSDECVLVTIQGQPFLRKCCSMAGCVRFVLYEIIVRALTGFTPMAPRTSYEHNTTVHEAVHANVTYIDSKLKIVKR